MNASIANLRLSSVSASPIVMRLGNLALARVLASNFFASFVCNPRSLTAERCSFARFLDTPIVVNSNYTGKYTSRPAQPASGDLWIYDAVFQDCTTTGYGGAIYQTGGAFTLTRTIFINCTATGSAYGGAVESEATAISVSFCCGYNCYALTYGQFLRIVLTNSSFTTSIILNYTTSILCGPSQQSSLSESIILTNGYEYIYFCNSSYNHVSSAKSAFAFDTVYSADLKYATMNYNVGTSCVRLKGVPQTVENCNFLNNSGQSSGGLFEIYGSATLSECVIMKNEANLFGGTGTATLNSCVISNTGSSYASAVLVSCSTGISAYITSPMSELNTYLCNHSYFMSSYFTLVKAPIRHSIIFAAFGAISIFE